MFFNERTKKPPAKPINMAKIVLATAKINPNSPTVIKKDDGSINGEDSHNSITADNGGPATNNTAMKRITPRSKRKPAHQQWKQKQSFSLRFPETLLQLKTQRPLPLGTQRPSQPGKY